MGSVRKFANGGANLEGILPLLQYVDDLLQPFNKPPVGTSVKPKADSQDPLNLRHNRNVRKSEEIRNQDDEDFSIEVGEEAGTKSNHRSAKAKGIREPEEPHVFPIVEDNYDGSLEKQRQDSVVDSMLPTRASSRKRVVVDVVIEIMGHDHPKNTRDGQLVYIERVAGVAMLERDGKVENCHEAALAAVMEQQKETTTSDMIWFSYLRTLRTPTGSLWS
ncbi:hypothetical protein ZWY2020_037758 [Hordeum vulgare]|nr:hypothetical protein ZWY2020_037758 [Hordeum vulgare]